MKRIVLSTLPILALAACSDSDEGNRIEEPKGNFTIESPVAFSNDPVEMQNQQENLVNMMINDPAIALDQVQGEALRRGVTLTDEQVAKKQSQNASTE